MSKDWAWQVGVLRGVGEAVWQQRSNTIRRLMHIMYFADGSCAPVKTFMCLAGKNTEPEFSATDLVITGQDLAEAKWKMADQVWSKFQITQG
jgi:hypothetical protein